MRRCGKQYASEEEAFRSKAGQAVGVEVTSCRCGSVHIIKPPAPAKNGKTRKPVNGNTIPPKVCKQVDKRDGRQCVRCGSQRDLHRHHRRIKGHGGDTRAHTDCACNVITLCETCHYWAHVLDRIEAETEGLIIPRPVTEPWRHGVMVHSEADARATRWPTCGGEYAGAPQAPGGIEVAGMLAGLREVR